MEKDNQKKYILRFAKGNKNSEFSFYAIKDGSKKVETRAATAKYQKIKKGDILVFVCGKERLEKQIKKVHCFKDISDMLKKFKVKDIMPDRNTRKELESAYFSYSGYEDKIKQFGLVAFELFEL